MEIAKVAAPVFVKVQPTTGRNQGRQLLVNAENIEYIDTQKNGHGENMQYTYQDEFGGTRRQPAIIEKSEIAKLGLDVIV